MYDILIKNIKIINGTGQDSYTGQIAIKNQKILLDPKGDQASRIIDGQGKVIAPGFIDMHTHSDVSFVDDPLCSSKLFQGVTSELAGCCGFSYFPSTDQGLDRLKDEEELHSELMSKSLFDFLKKTEHLEKTINLGLYVGHGTLRTSVVGFDDVKASKEEIESMKVLLDRELSGGAYGLSLGIAYAPGMFANTQEFIELGKIVAKHNKLITAHIRSENDGVFDAIEEMIEVGRQSKAHIHISHLKLGYGNWHRTKKLFEIFEKARSEGIQITYEQYPYIASSTGLSVILPDWVHDGGKEKMLYRLREETQAVRAGIKASNSYRMGLDRVVVVSTKGILPELDGLNIKEIAKQLNLSDVDTVMYLLEISAGDLPTIRFTMDEGDVLEIMKREDCAVISDGSAYSLNPDQVNGKPHPRNYGTFPRAIRLNREHGFMSLEKMIYKMTGLPSKLTHMDHRGLIQEGWFADLVIFDEETIADQATFENPFQKPIGIDYVIVNGQIVVEDGQATKMRPGIFL